VNILGISAYYHDAAACLLVDGEIVAAAQEERFTRRKHDPSFPLHACAYCLREGGLRPEQLDYVAFYDKPLVKFDRLLATYLAVAPRGFVSFAAAMPWWLKEKLWLPDVIRRELARLDGADTARELRRRARSYRWRLLFGDHHESHAASAFYPSPFEEAAILTVDAVGEWATASIGVGRGHEIRLLYQLPFPDSLGLLYSAFTYFTGFKVNSGEYKLMGLAPYGEPRYVDLIRRHLVDIQDDGSIRLDLRYFTYCQSLRMTGRAFAALFGGPPRTPDRPLTHREMDLARSIQEVTEEVLLKMARFAHAQTGCSRLAMAGGVALNCVANGRIVREGPFEDVWIQPAAGDAGGAVGVALAVWHRYLGRPRASAERRGRWISPRAWRETHRAPVAATPARSHRAVGAMRADEPTLPPYEDGMKGALLGPAFSAEAIAAMLERRGAPARRHPRHELPDAVAALLAAGKVVGLLQGRMEFGPRALGARSILADPRIPTMQSTLNRKIKFRESFRPFAPSVLREHVAEWFELDEESPYMLLVAGVRPDRRRDPGPTADRLWGIERLQAVRSQIPAVTHVDYSARIQTVRREVAPLFWEILDAFYRRTGCPVLVNTSFNVRGEPIVCTPEDAYRCFMRTQMDALVLEEFVLEKAEQPPFDDTEDWRRAFCLD
jgi:carbamoyltransferase